MGPPPEGLSLMSYLYYSIWMLAEHLRLWNDVRLLGCLWWSEWDLGAARRSSEDSASGSNPPLHGRGPVMDRTPPSYFERLVASAERIARHAAYPGKQQAVDHCVEDVKDLIALGRITADQGAILLDILLGTCPQVA